MHVDDLWWLEGTGAESDVFDAGWENETDASLEDIFSDIGGAVAKVATAPVDLVAKALPKPVRKPFKTVATLGSPTQIVARTVRGQRVSGAPVRRVSRPTTARAAKVRGMVRAAPKRGGAFGAIGGQVRAAAQQALGTADSRLMETMVKTLGARDIAQIAAGAKPRLAARSTGKKVADQALVNMVAGAVAKKLGPDLTSINKKLRLAANQRTATSEHLALKNTAAFRKKVLQDLLRISTCLPAQHPTRARIRKLGLMSGLL